MKLVEKLELNKINIICPYSENNNRFTSRLFIDENENLIFKLYFFPKFSKPFKTDVFMIQQNDKLLYKFYGKNLLKQSEFRYMYDKNIFCKCELNIYFINLYQNTLFYNNNSENQNEKSNIIQSHENISYIPRELLIYNLDMNPEFEYYFFNNKARRKFIKKNYDRDYLTAYDTLIPGAYKCDFFRLLALHALGGIYMDHKVVLMYRLAEFIENKFFFVCDLVENNIYNAFMIIKKNDHKINKLIKLFLKKILNKHKEGNNCLEFGPFFFKRHIDFGEKYDTFLKINIFDNGLYNPHCDDMYGKKYFYSAYNEYYSSHIINDFHYAKMYDTNQVYTIN